MTVRPIRYAGLVLVAATVLSLAVVASAAEYKAIQFTFGDRPYSGAIAPAYVPAIVEGGIQNNGGEGKLTLADGTAWNQIQAYEAVITGFVHADDTPATGVTLTMGGWWSDRDDLYWGYGGAAYTHDEKNIQGVQATDLMWTSLYAGQYAITVAVTGLAPGVYQVFVPNVVPNDPGTRELEVVMAVFSTSLGNIMNESLAAEGFHKVNGMGADLTENALVWKEGLNYVQRTLVIESETDVLVVASYCFLENSPGPLLNAIQIVPVIPEPATMTLLALGGLALLRRRK